MKIYRLITTPFPLLLKEGIVVLGAFCPGKVLGVFCPGKRRFPSTYWVITAKKALILESRI
jgi:hypothetical protein